MRHQKGKECLNLDYRKDYSYHTLQSGWFLQLFHDQNLTIKIPQRADDTLISNKTDANWPDPTGLNTSSSFDANPRPM